LLNVLAHTTPARSRLAIHRIREPLSVQIPADRPYGVLLAFSIASAGCGRSAPDSTGRRSPRGRSGAPGETLVKMVGANQKPFSGSSHGGDQRSAPSASPTAVSSRIRASCSAELIAPTSVFLSSGSPRRSVPAGACSASSTSSWIDSCTSSREPAQQTWPWLKKMPLTMPSTAWSIGASSNTMFAALPPSSSVSFLPVPATARAIARRPRSTR
jgi:hypothetical protein